MFYGTVSDQCFSEELNAKAAALLYNYQLCCNTLLTSLLMKRTVFCVDSYYCVPIYLIMGVIYQEL